MIARVVVEIGDRTFESSYSVPDWEFATMLEPYGFVERVLDELTADVLIELDGVLS